MVKSWPYLCHLRPFFVWDASHSLLQRVRFRVRKKIEGRPLRKGWWGTIPITLLKSTGSKLPNTLSLWNCAGKSIWMFLPCSLRGGTQQHSIMDSAQAIHTQQNSNRWLIYKMCLIQSIIHKQDIVRIIQLLHVRCYCDLIRKCAIWDDALIRNGCEENVY